MAEKEYIERDAAKKKHCEICLEECICYRSESTCGELKAFDLIPAADVRPVKRGHWVKRMEEHATTKYTSFTPIWSCSECGLEYDPALAPRIHFCYNCGADMRELQNG